MTSELTASIAPCIDQIASEFAAPPWDREITSARREFDARRGTVHDDEPMFETHMAAFLEWYVLDRSLPDGAAPILRVLKRGAPSGDARLMRALALSHHSLFEVMEHTSGGPRLLDLVRGGVWRIAQEHPSSGLGRGEIFEARLIPWRGAVCFGPVFVFHPREARRCIHDLIRQVEPEGGEGDHFIALLATMRLKHIRSRNIAIDHIYAMSGGGNPG